MNIQDELSWEYIHVYGMPSLKIQINFSGIGSKTPPTMADARRGNLLSAGLGLYNPGQGSGPDSGPDSGSGSGSGLGSGPGPGYNSNSKYRIPSSNGDESEESEPVSDDYDDDDDDDDDDETFIYLYPSPERRPLSPTSPLIHYVSAIIDEGVARFALFWRREAAPQRVSPPHKVFACPFYLHNPSRHRTCLRDDLKRIIDVKRHLWARHRRPYDCPVCGAAFDAMTACDSHIRQGDCMEAEPETASSKPDELREDTVSESQLQRLARRAPSGMSEDGQWEAICKIVLPQEVPPPVGARDDTLLRQAAALRRFWSEEYGGIITQVLENTGDGRNLGSRDRRALRDAALDAMVERLVAGNLVE